MSEGRLGSLRTPPPGSTESPSARLRSSTGRLSKGGQQQSPMRCARAPRPADVPGARVSQWPLADLETPGSTPCASRAVPCLPVHCVSRWPADSGSTLLIASSSCLHTVGVLARTTYSSWNGLDGAASTTMLVMPFEFGHQMWRPGGLLHVLRTVVCGVLPWDAAVTSAPAHLHPHALVKKYRCCIACGMRW